MGKTLILGVLVGTAAGLASVFVIKLIGVELTPAVTAGAVGASVGAVVSGAFARSKPSSDS